MTGDDAGADASRCHFDNFQADVVGQGTAVDEDAAQLVDAPLACKREGGKIDSESLER